MATNNASIESGKRTFLRQHFEIQMTGESIFGKCRMVAITNFFEISDASLIVG